MKRYSVKLHDYSSGNPCKYYLKIHDYSSDNTLVRILQKFTITALIILVEIFFKIQDNKSESP